MVLGSVLADRAGSGHPHPLPGRGESRPSGGQARLRRLARLRSLEIILLVLALAGPSVLLPSRRRHVGVLLDVSESVGPAQIELARRTVLHAIGCLRPQGRVAVVSFAGGVRVLTPLTAPDKAAALLESAELLGKATANFSARCVEGLEATERGPALVEQGLMLATALAPVIGYDEAAKLAKEAFRTGRTIRELALERGLPKDQLDELLDPAKMTEPGLGGGPVAG